MTLWDLLYGAGLPVYAPAIAWKRLRHGKYRQSLPAMLGKRLPNPGLPPHRERCWLHSVSVGETVAAGAVFRELRAQRPDWEFLSSTTTETGQQQALQSLKEAQWHTYAPADFSPVVRKFLNAWRPTLYLVLETELWPNLLGECGRRGLPAYLVNGKLSERSAARYEKARVLFAPMLRAFRLCLMQNQEYAERMARILRDDSRIHVTGNVKFDALPDPLPLEERELLREAWDIGSRDVLLIAGSTHEGEEELLAQCYTQLREEGLPLRMMIAPRHPERFDAVAALLEKHFPGRVQRLSNGAVPPELVGRSAVLLLDQMRVLARYFGAADLAAVGGSWKPVGGHNLLEAAIHGIPVLCGPHLHNQPELRRILEDAGADLIREERAVAETLRGLLGNPELREDLGQKSRAAALANKGAAKRTVELILAQDAD